MKIFGIERVKDENKVQANKILQKLSSERRYNRGEALILDTERLQTTKSLMKAGFKKYKIHVPNPHIYEKVRKVHRKTYNAYLSEFLGYLKRVGRESITLAYFDYMASLAGNPTCHPRKDINDFFAFKIPAKNCIFAVEVSARTGRTENKPTYATGSELNSIVANSAYLNGYTALNLGVGYAYNGMVFEVFQILKK